MRKIDFSQLTESIIAQTQLANLIVLFKNCLAVRIVRIVRIIGTGEKLQKMPVCPSESLQARHVFFCSNYVDD